MKMYIDIWSSLTIYEYMKFVPMVRINNIPALPPGGRQAIIWTNDV